MSNEGCIKRRSGHDNVHSARAQSIPHRGSVPEVPSGGWQRKGSFAGALRCSSLSGGDGRSSNSWTTSLKATCSHAHLDSCGE